MLKNWGLSRGKGTATALLNGHAFRLLSKYLRLHAQSCVAFNFAHRDFLLKQVVVNAGTHNWSKAQYTCECSGAEEPSLSTSLSQGSWNFWEERMERTLRGSRRWAGRAVKCCLLDAAWQRHAPTYSSCGFLHQIKAIKTVAWIGRGPGKLSSATVDGPLPVPVWAALIGISGS